MYVYIKESDNAHKSRTDLSIFTNLGSMDSNWPKKGHLVGKSRKICFNIQNNINITYI